MASTRNCDALLEWLQDNQNKLYWNKQLVDIKASANGGVGVFARKDIHRVEDDVTLDSPGLLLRISKNSILSGANSSIANLLYESHIDGILALVLAFLYEKAAGMESPWHSYIDSIDLYEHGTDTLICPPSLWDDTDKALLNGTDADLMGVTGSEQLQDEFSVAVEFAKQTFVQPPSELSVDDGDDYEVNEAKFRHFAAAFYAVTSRAFVIDDYQQLALVPGADLFNHDSNGDEDVHFVALARVCPFCGRGDSCGHDEYGPPDSECEDYDMEEEDESDEDDDSDDTPDSEMISEQLIAKLDDEITEEQEQDLAERREMDSIRASMTDVEFERQQILQNSDQCCDIVVSKDVPAGKELMNCYGDFASALLLAKYGFVAAGNPHDTVCLGKQLIDYKKKHGKVGERLEWWREDGYQTLCDYQRLMAAEDEEGGEEDGGEDEDEDNDEGSEGGDDDGDQEDNEDETDNDSAPDSWLLDVAIDFDGQFSVNAVCVAKLVTMTAKQYRTLVDGDASTFTTFVDSTPDNSASNFLRTLCEARLKSLSGAKSPIYKLFKANKLHNSRQLAAVTLLSNELSILTRALDQF